MESHVKDEQIKAQAETITSLERKVESLEKELQRHLDPDSGEIRPTWTPERQKSKAEQYAGYKANGGTMTMQEWENDSRYDPSLAGEYRYEFKSGEARLLHQIEDLQRQLGDCLEPGNNLISNDRLNQRISDVVDALFLPVRCYSRRAKDVQWESQPWWYLREFLFESELFSDHWSRAEFRLGVDMLNDMCQASEATGVKGGLTKKHLERFDFAMRLFGGGSAEWNEKKSIAVQELTAALLAIIQNYEQVAKQYLEIDDLYDMLAALKVLAFCQKLWTDAKPEPEPAVTDN